LEIGPVERLPDDDTLHHPYGGLEYTPREVLVVMTSRVNGPITVAIVDDYDVVMMGLAQCSISTATAWLSPSSTRNEALVDTVDIALYNSFAQPESDHEEAQPESDHEEIAVLVANPRARRVVVYTWNFHPDLIHSARQQGAHGYLSKTLPARELVIALEAVHAGETIISGFRRARSAVGLDWPSRGEGLSDRESKILALITQGESNAGVLWSWTNYPSQDVFNRELGKGRAPRLVRWTPHPRASRLLGWCNKSERPFDDPSPWKRRA
jgi:DNA-binding NarL/FixJ family response regulator